MEQSLVLVIGSIRLPAGALDRARAAMRDMIEASRTERGCVAYAYSEDVLEPGLIHVKELWSSREAFAAHLQTPHLKTWRSKWRELEISDRDLVSYDIAHPRQV
jgi:quinol monooxygenase YgiN